MSSVLWPLALGLLPLAPIAWHRWKRARCRHLHIAAASTGETLCLDCFKRSPFGPWARPISEREANYRDLTQGRP